ncbi:MAG: carboxynorspermidine decarboxylase [Oscillospiraceae bacterium]
MDLDFFSLKTPCYVLDEGLLERNLLLLDNIQKRTGCKILLAQKAFSMYHEYPLIGKYLKGTTASSLYEAKLGAEEMGGETHIFAPAYVDNEFDELLEICDHIVFNSFTQWGKFRKKVENSPKKVECGIRINPEYSEIETDIYNPCFAGSRLGVTLENFRRDELCGISGLHFHTMCEQNSDVLARTVKVVDEKFGDVLKQMKWLNFGGGHHITRQDYDVETLVKTINFVREKYDVDVYLEPGEAVALNTGFLISEVLDIVDNGVKSAILDASAACHMPDVLEMPYRPEILGAGKIGEFPNSYRLGGNTCLAGDIIGDYSFEKPLKIGDKLVFCDMAIYSMVKNNTFNGIRLPSIAVYNKDCGVKVLKNFGYDDFKSRL